jgi:hypothetical protein
MILPIDDDYQISSDRECWYIEYRTQGQWRQVKRYWTLSGVITGLAQMQLRESDACNLAQALDEVDAIVERLRCALAPHYSVERLEDESYAA